MFPYQEQDYPVSATVQEFMTAVYGWMSLALFITAGIAYYTGVVSPTFYIALTQNPGLLFFLIIFQLFLVIGLAAFMRKLSFPVALGMFLLYAALTGLTLSGIFLIYTAASIYSTFVVTAGMFGAMSLYGYFTRSDLTALGSMAIMALFGLIIGLLVNMFLRSPAFDFMLSGAGVVIFTLLTAYDVQKLKRLGSGLIADQDTIGKVALLGALTLYLDFVNLFLYLLRFMGKRRNN